MSLVDDFKTALAAIEPQVFRLIGGAADFASIKGEPPAWPAAYVMIEADESEPSERALGGPPLQRNTAEVAVVIVTRNLAGAKGAAAAVDIEALKQTVRDALIGIVPEAAAENGNPIEHLGGTLLQAKAGTVWHRELFSVVTYIGEAT